MINRFQIVRRYGETDFVTTLRAIAATMVVIIHAGAFSDFGTLGQNIVESGKYGVQIFFVISGFSIATTFATASNYREFFVRRLFRIVPLYWLMIVVVGALTLSGLLPRNHWSEHFGTEVDAYNILMHLSFLSCFDHTIGTTILGVEWTIPIEMFWYAALPPIIVFTTTRQRLIQAIVFSALGIGLTQLAARIFVSFDPGLFAKWFPTSYGPYFLLGVLGYRIRQANNTWLHRNATWILATAWITTVICVAIHGPAQGVIFAVVTFLTIGLFHADRHPIVGTVVTSQPLIFVGSISYSLYLVHFPVVLFFQKSASMSVGWKLFALSYSASLILSTLLYLFIECPMNQLGKKLSGRRPELLSPQKQLKVVPDPIPGHKAS